MRTWSKMFGWLIQVGDAFEFHAMMTTRGQYDH